MTDRATARSLFELTGTWKPSSGVGAAELAEARRHLASALVQGTAPATLRPRTAFHAPLSIGTAGGSKTAIDQVVADLPKAEPAFVPVIRNALDLDLTSQVSAVIGAQPSKSLGPFTDAMGIPHYVDIFPIAKKIAIESTTHGTLAEIIATNTPPAALGAGSLWIAVPGLGIAGSGAVGVSFSSATSQVQGALQNLPDKIVIAPGVTLTLQLTIAPVPAPAAGPGVGADATNMVVTSPAHATFVFTAAGVTVTAFDDGLATVYGTSLTCTRNGKAPRRVSVGGDVVVFPCDVSVSQFPVVNCLSKDVVVSGAAPIGPGGAGWALGVTTQPLATLGAAPGGGGIFLDLATGLSLEVGASSAPVPLASTQLVLAPGAIVVGGTLAQAVSRRFTLWRASPSDPDVVPPASLADSTVEFRAARLAPFVASVSPASESIIVAMSARANVDRPLAGDGRRLALQFDAGFAGFLRDQTAQRVLYVGAAAQNAAAAGGIALENALARCGPARGFFLNTARQNTQLIGLLGLALDLIEIIPTLPDPYAASFPIPTDAGSSGLQLAALVAWSAAPKLGFVLAGAEAALPQGAASLLRPNELTLLDLSTNADQFGVRYLRREEGFVTVDGLALTAPQHAVGVYTLPGISWEPVVRDDTVDWYDAYSPDDGPPTTLSAQTVDLIRIEPNVALPKFAAAAANAPVDGTFTLPFGLTAHLDLGAQKPTHAHTTRPTFSLIKAHYPSGVAAGRQLSITAHARPSKTPKNSDPALPGTTTTGEVLPLPDPSMVYGAQILGANEQIVVAGSSTTITDTLSAAQFFDQQFAAGGKYPEIPVTRIDISGYGTSMFSDWHNQSFAKPNTGSGVSFVGVVRVRFDVLIGRTAYDLIQIQSVIAPWSIPISRTIIFDRFDNGLVVRHDTGWKAVGDGRFGLLASGQVLPGAMDKLVNVHNITVAPGAPIQFTSPDKKDPQDTTKHRTIEFVPVTFDADVVFAGGVTGIANGKVAPSAAATHIVGYVQRTVGEVASAAEVIELMNELAASGITVNGTLGAILKVGKKAGTSDPNFTLNVSSFSAASTTGTVPGLAQLGVAVAMHGTPRLPRDGAWSVGRRPRGAAAPTAVDPAAPIPLVLAQNASAATEWRLLDPVDALSVADPASLYGLLQSTGTSKVFFEHLVVDAAGKSLAIDTKHLPKLADVGALLGATDIFPNLAGVLELPITAGSALDLKSEGLEQPFDWDLGTGEPERELLKLGKIRLVLQYKSTGNGPQGPHARLEFDPNAAARWSFRLGEITLAAYIDGLSAEPIINFRGEFSGNELVRPAFSLIEVSYGDALKDIVDIMHSVSELVKAIGGDVALDVGFSGNVLTVHQGFVLPTLPLGIGEVRDLGIDLGMSIEIPDKASFHVGIGGKPQTANNDSGLRLTPFTWVVSPLTGDGTLSIGVVDGELAVYLEAGVGAALEINVAVASGAASIMIEFAISTEKSPFTFYIKLIGHAEVDVLDGLVSASLTLSAGVGIRPIGGNLLAIPPDLPDAAELSASVGVGIHISIVWVIDIDFDGSWEFSKTIPLSNLIP